jgi:hypothetical protein
MRRFVFFILSILAVQSEFARGDDKFEAYVRKSCAKLQTAYIDRDENEKKVIEEYLDCLNRSLSLDRHIYSQTTNSLASETNSLIRNSQPLFGKFQKNSTGKEQTTCEKVFDITQIQSTINDQEKLKYANSLVYSCHGEVEKKLIFSSANLKIEDLIQGTLKLGNLKETVQGDIVIQRGEMAPRFMDEHAVVSAVGRTDKCEKDTYPVYDATADGFLFKCQHDSKSQVAYHIEDAEVRQNLISILGHNVDTKTTSHFSILKAVRNACSPESQKEITSHDEEKIVKKVLIEIIRKELVDSAQGKKVDAQKVKSIFSHHMEDEICSTYAGNSLITALLLKKYNSNRPKNLNKFEEALGNTQRFMNGEISQDALDKSFSKVVMGLLKNDEFRKFMEFKTSDTAPSILYQKNVDRMLPKDLLQFLAEHSVNPCILARAK